jgi:hypothetical protein
MACASSIRSRCSSLIASIPDLDDLAAYGHTDKEAVAHVTELNCRSMRSRSAMRRSSVIRLDQVGPSWPPPLLALIRLWRKRGPGVEAHLGQSGEAFDLCKRGALVLVVPKSNRREHY